MKTFIVIGASAASVAFISKLRSFDKVSRIICFSGENYLPYNRCFLADFLTNECLLQDLQLKPADFFTKNNVELHVNAWVSQIDVTEKRVLVENSWHLYDELFLGIGTRPFVPKCMQEITAEGIYTFHTLADMQNIQNFIHKAQPKTVLVVGAGLNGIEAASSLVQLGLSVGIVAAKETVLAGQLDQQASSWLADLMRQHGVLIINNQKVIQVFSDQGRIVAARLGSGTIIFIDMIVVTAGSTVNIELVKDTGIKLDQGSVLVDQFLKTTVDHVWAAGDLCAVPDMISKEIVRSTTWSDAMLQGLCAATNFSDQPRRYAGVLGLRDSYFFGKDFYACGKTVGHSKNIEVVSKINKENLQHLYLQEGVLIGFVLMGDISCLAELKQWYMTGQKIDNQKNDK